MRLVAVVGELGVGRRGLACGEARRGGVGAGRGEGDGEEEAEEPEERCQPHRHQPHHHFHRALQYHLVPCAFSQALS